MSDRSVRWSQDAIRRAAMAMRESFSNDVYEMARIALQAAVRTETDLLALLDDRPKPAFSPKKSRPKKPAPAEAA